MKEAFRNLVNSAGEVNPDSFPDLFKKAPLLSIAKKEGTLIATAAIKTPNKSHHTKILGLAEVSSAQETYLKALGWIVVDPNYRRKGLGGSLVERLLQEENDALYASVREDNFGMIKILKKYHFSKLGNAYCSEKSTSKKIQLFVRSKQKIT